MQTNWQRLLNGNSGDPSILEIRSRVLAAVRTFFYNQAYLEIESPLLTPFPTLDNNIESIACQISTPDGRILTRYLHTSPEHAMKKVLSSGSGSLFFLGKVFRNNEFTSLHNPEYTMAEWYQTPGTVQNIMQETESLIFYTATTVFGTSVFTYQGLHLDLTPPWQRISVSELFQRHYGIDKTALRDTSKLRQCALDSKIHFQESDSWEVLFHRLFMEKIEPSLAVEKPVFVTEYPVEMGLMAKLKSDDPAYVERAELYIGGIELANGYSELTDSVEQHSRFQEQVALKHAAGYQDYPIDFELLESLRTLSPCAGMALGIDRLIMILLNKTHIRDVILFPL